MGAQSKHEGTPGVCGWVLFLLLVCLCLCDSLCSFLNAVGRGKQPNEALTLDAYNLHARARTCYWKHKLWYNQIKPRSLILLFHLEWGPGALQLENRGSGTGQRSSSRGHGTSRASPRAPGNGTGAQAAARVPTFKSLPSWPWLRSWPKSAGWRADLNEIYPNIQRDMQTASTRGKDWEALRLSMKEAVTQQHRQVPQTLVISEISGPLHTVQSHSHDLH